MSAFDKRVCEWLNGASIPAKSKQTILNRMNVGITNYRALELEKLTTVPAAKILSEHKKIDYSLQDDIAKALYRLEDGTADPSSGLLFPGLARAPEEDSALDSTAAPRSAHDDDDVESQPAALETFTFGSGDETPFASTAHDDGDDIDDGEADATELEAMRYRMMKRQSRNAVSAEPINIEAAKAFHLPHVPKNPDIVKRLVKVLEGHHLFSSLEDRDIEGVANAMDISNFNRSEIIAPKGSSSDRLYVVVTGSVVVKDTDAQRKILMEGTFGDVGLMYDVQHAETYEATMNNTQVCSIDRTSYQSLCSRASLEKRATYEGFLSQVQTLKSLTATERLQIADALKTSKYRQGEKVISYGEEGKWFFIIIEGTVEVVGRNDAGKEVPVCTFSVGQPIGELELLHKHKAVADCVAATPFVTVAKMTGNHFEKVIGPAKEFLQRQAATDEIYTYYRQTKKTS